MRHSDSKDRARDDSIKGTLHLQNLQVFSLPAIAPPSICSSVQPASYFKASSYSLCRLLPYPESSICRYFSLRFHIIYIPSSIRGFGHPPSWVRAPISLIVLDSMSFCRRAAPLGARRPAETLTVVAICGSVGDVTLCIPLPLLHKDSAGFAINTMKFGKRLQRLLDDSLPDWRDQFISYKLLKQSLKLIIPADDGNALCFSQCGGESRRRLTRPEAVFIALLFSEVHKMNTFFSGKEEEFVIRSQDAKGKFDKILKTGGNLELSQEIIDIRKAIVNIHGEMVLLENYSALNYTGLVKIIKKHDKRTGGVLRMPFIQSVLQEPFFATDIISKLVQECEEMLQMLFPHSSFSICRPLNSSEKQDDGDQQDSFPTYFELSEAFVGDDNVERICRNTIAAWQIMKEFRKGSSTYNLFSIPPFGFAEYDEGPCCKSAITEQLCCYPEIPVGPNL